MNVAMSQNVKSLTLSTGNLCYLEMGCGPTLIFLHGRSGLRVSPVLEALSKTYRLLMPITPGQDDTSHHEGVNSMRTLSDLMAEFIRETVSGPCHLMGHSFGAWLAAWLAVRHSALVKLLILEGPAGFRASGTRPVAASPEEWRRLFYTRPERAPTDGATFEQEAANRSSVNHYNEGVLIDEPLVAVLASIQAETLILYGSEERMIPIETCDILKNGIPHSHLTHILGAGHMAQFDQPERMTPIIEEFLGLEEASLVTLPREA
ncbi:MAG: hypothetical protein CBD27_04430 [Rhodospirillaceae bacterium TMED167]|nr:hypothetical protein [Rhodospirillaceae bacterium]OUW28558.1 MAG: hypothetical protein CBD27_04430 [Rhodospirillaceae bacterium TMED167]